MSQTDWNLTRKEKHSWEFNHASHPGNTKKLDFNRNEVVYMKDGIVTKKYPFRKRW